MADDVTLCILAGGEARRMGQPKAEICIRGTPILEQLLSQLRWSGPTMLVTAPGRQRPPGWMRFDCEVVDPVAGEGPLRGLFTALQNAGTELSVVLSVDMPLVERGQLRWLVSAMRHRPRALGLMLRHVVLEPFPSIYRRTAIDVVQRRLQSDRKSLASLAEEPGFETVEAPTQWDASVWLNLNTPEDLKQLD